MFPYHHRLFTAAHRYVHFHLLNYHIENPARDRAISTGTSRSVARMAGARRALVSLSGVAPPNLREMEETGSSCNGYIGPASL